MNNAEVAHRWAAQSTNEANGSNMSFNGPAIYSWVTCIGRFYETKYGKFVLLNNSNYSGYSSRHQSTMRRALHGRDDVTFTIGKLSRGVSLDYGDKVGDAIYDYVIECAAECQTKAKKARTNKPFLLGQAEEYLKEAQRVSEFFRLKKKPDDKLIEKLVKKTEEANKRYKEEVAMAKKRQEERDALELIDLQRYLNDWLAGANAHWHGFNRLPCQLRAVQNNAEDLIETSHGAVIPYEDGKRCFLFYMKVREKGWRRNGEKFQVGPYELDSAGEGGIVAGCHRISHETIVAFAEAEGWMTVQSTEGEARKISNQINK